MLKFLSFYQRVTAHVRNRGQSIHHLTSLHHDDTAGRHRDTEDMSLRKPQAQSAFVVAVSGLRTHLKIRTSGKEKKKKKKSTPCRKKYSPKIPDMFSKMIIFRGIIDHTAQQYNLFHLTSFSALLFICRGNVLVGKKLDSNVVEHKSYTSYDIWIVSLAAD